MKWTIDGLAWLTLSPGNSAHHSTNLDALYPQFLAGASGLSVQWKQMPSGSKPLLLSDSQLNPPTQICRQSRSLVDCSEMISRSPSLGPGRVGQRRCLRRRARRARSTSATAPFPPKLCAPRTSPRSASYFPALARFVATR